jgi:predicted nucleic acid-binding protein
MLLADTSVWIGHLRSGDKELSAALEEGSVVVHPFVSGELACGNLARREVFLSEMSALPMAVVATDAEVRHLVEKRRMWGRGLGWVDAHLLASAILSPCRLWTLDRALRKAALELGVAWM